MARMTKKLVATIWDWTNACYKRALHEANPGVFTAQEVAESSDSEMKYKLLELEKTYKSPEINALYLKYLLQLPTDQLSLVLEAHNKGKIRRKQHTVDSILNELFERSANSETRDTNE